MGERRGRAGRQVVELAGEDGVERRETLVSEHVAIALRRVLHPVALGLLGQVDEPGGERLGLGRDGAAGREMELAHLDAQRIHVGIGGAELAERLVDAEDCVLGERDAARMALAHELVQLDERLVDARGKARRAAPGGLARGLRDGREALAHRDGVDRADGERDLHVEPIARRPRAREVVRHRRQASTLAPRGVRDCGTCSGFRAAIQARYLVTIVFAPRPEIGSEVHTANAVRTAERLSGPAASPGPRPVRLRRGRARRRRRSHTVPLRCDTAPMSVGNSLRADGAHAAAKRSKRSASSSRSGWASAWRGSTRRPPWKVLSNSSIGPSSSSSRRRATCTLQSASTPTRSWS